jgi:N-acyl-D-aspartate/D-glutamate deacylase
MSLLSDIRLDNSPMSQIKAQVLGFGIRHETGLSTALPAADSQIDAQGLIVCPGFIDMHSHADWVLPLANHAPILKCLVEQGITTVVAGNCGISPAPMTPDARARTEVLASIVTAGALDYPWRSMADYLIPRGEPEPADQHGPARRPCHRALREQPPGSGRHEPRGP